MNYLEAANIRSKGFAQLMTEKLLAGQGVFSSIRSTRADRSMAQKIARKEKYDILNIARFLTGGNKLATALVGKMAGRSTEDIRYFVGKGKNKTYTPERPTNYWNRVMGGSGESIEATPVLQQILEILQKTEEDRNIENETLKIFREGQQDLEDDRHKEIMNVFIRAMRKKRRAAMKISVKPSPLGVGLAAAAGLALVGAPAMAAIKRELPSVSETTEKPEMEVGETTTPMPEKPLTPPPEPTPPIPTLPTISTAPRTPVKTLDISRRAERLSYAERVAMISVRGETSQTTRSGAIAKGGQIVPNDPKPGVYSYGIFGLNSGSSTIQTFILENPQFGLTAKPGTPEFNQQWENLAKTKGNELYNAQLLWYQNNILEPIKSYLKTVLPPDIANDARVVGYMADRRIQYGGVMENSAIKYSSVAQNGEEFLQRMTEFDMANLGKAFKTYLANNPKNIQGLQNRVQNRLRLSMNIGKGEMLYENSVDTERLAALAEEQMNAPVIINRQQNFITSENVVAANPVQEINPIIVQQQMR